MRQPDHEYEERSFGDIQRAIDFENSMNDLESQLYYRRLSPKEVAQQVLKARVVLQVQHQRLNVGLHAVQVVAGFVVALICQRGHGVQAEVVDQLVLGHTPLHLGVQVAVLVRQPVARGFSSRWVRTRASSAAGLMGLAT